ncbi:Endonuclease, Uma2 family (restriction endonuclease fold) [Ruminococcus sp. YE71]|uniref:Uma2 family endonuclease n=1 Tax=unclassified Ruminococcus TaxID=2608920 RepID=UPI00088AE942|nr:MULTISPECIES: Uma2 family endonuclease [unclassified Ruminococcus]SDA09592.1 Endonuclease, Uma2 family (restriction endonuclease fold) [Ruminococcus sp. YE78]SFW11904.1 Endonuclease, Uma2 family (restriction endonuclease fold) [Ruminococcus sp. YE71]
MENIVMERKYTADEYYAALEWIRERSELINGGIDYMPTPNIRHQQILLALSSQINAYLSARGSGFFVLTSADVKLDDNNIVVPDIFVASDRSKLDDVKFNGAPELIIEIASDTPSDEYFKKLVLYKETGVREYWIVDPKSEKITLYFFEAERFAESFGFGETVNVAIFGQDDPLAINLAQTV